jgi:DNA-binding transcriptional ArsR family regulator
MTHHRSPTIKGLDECLEALANVHRREIVYMLSLQPCTISFLADERELSLPAMHKHVKVLENAGLVRRRKVGRTNVLVLNAKSLNALQKWLGQFQTHWGGANGSLDNYTHYLARTGQ